MMDWGNGGWSAGDWVAMSTMMILFWGLLVVVAVWAVRTVRSDRGGASQRMIDLERQVAELRAERDRFEGPARRP